MEHYTSGLNDDFISKIKYFYYFKLSENKNELINDQLFENDTLLGLNPHLYKLYLSFRLSSHFIQIQNKLFVTEDDRVYGFGENSEGVLGFGHKIVVIELTIIPELCNKQIIEFKNGLNYCIARSIDGRLYSFGSNEANQLGYETENEYNKPKIIESLIDENIVEVSCGAFYTLVLTQNGKLFGWGCNNFGPIETDNKNIPKHENQVIPNKLEVKSEKFVAISCGSCHSLALTIDGKVFSWGRNDCGQLGINSTVDSFIPQMIEMNNKNVLFKKISCGSAHSLLLSTNGDIYSFGSNTNKQLGYETDEDIQLIPRMIEISPKIQFSDIFCKFIDDFSAANSSTDSICYIWGTYEKITLNEILKTGYNHFEDMFLNMFGITVKTEKKPLELFQTFIRNNYFHTVYHELEKLSEGSYGEVFKAVNKLNEKSYAIKRLKLASQNAYNEKLLKEIQLMSSLKSDYVVKYLDSWVESIENPNQVNEHYCLYIEMELCLKTLNEVNEQLIKELNCKQSLCECFIGYYVLSDLLKEVIEGINYLHENNIIHRDLKPKNILITEFKKGRIVKIADFGISCYHKMRLTDDCDIASHTGDVGDQRYMAPELEGCFGRVGYDEKVDIYSLGLIFEELIGKLDKKLLVKSEYMLSKIDNLTKVIEQMKSENPEDRPDCEELLEYEDSIFMNIIELFDVEEIENKYFKIKIDSESNCEKLLFDYFEKKLFYKLIHDFTLPKTTFLLFISQLTGQQIIELNIGMEYGIALSINGKLYSFGENESKQLGYQSDFEGYKRPKIIESLINENVIQVSCGSEHTIVLTENGEVFGWGDNTNGQVGINSEEFNQLIPRKIEGFNNEKIQSISCGSLHSMELTVNGNVFSWGHNISGQLGINSTEYDIYSPKQIIMESNRIKFKKMNCGQNHSLLLSTNGDIYSFGCNSSYQLGYETVEDKQFIPKMIETNPKIEFSDISCLFCEDFSAALSSPNGFRYVWGKCGEEIVKSPEKTKFKYLDIY